MPIFMDLHIVPGVTAKKVAEAHREDLLIQEQFHCNCMTYWIDEAKESVFCLIEAPDAHSVRELHNNSHGLTPHQIIQVNSHVVESFLGRLYDPENHQIENDSLKVFNDPAYRVLVLINILHPLLMDKKFESASVQILNEKYLKTIGACAREFEGEIAEHNENITTILSFTSSSKAVKCALAIQDSFLSLQRKEMNMKISIYSGMPVSNSSRIFGETIDCGKMLFNVAKPDCICVSSQIDVSNLNQNRKSKGITKLTSSEEKFLKQITKVIENNSGNESFSVDDFAEELNLSKSSLNRGIQSLTGMSPNTFIKEHRLNKAVELLNERNLPVSEIAFATGFRSPSYFSKCFKEHYDISPSTFQVQLGK